MLRIGILGAADIAYNKFIPAIEKVEGVCCAGIASNSQDKLSRFTDKYQVKVFSSYDELISSDKIDCVYVPLPPVFHYEWGKKALKAGKHVYLEKPSTMNAGQTMELADIAREKNLVIQENYMYLHHAQLAAIKDIISSGELGKIRLLRTSFGFPRRPEGDFRYNPSLGGGTMMDNAGYTLRLISELLGEVRLKSASLDYDDVSGVDIFGTAEFVNEDGIMAQAAFGMDCQYQCSLEIWGSKGRLTTNRIYTAPAGFKPSAVIESQSGTKTVELPEDDHFAKAIEVYKRAVDEKNQGNSNLADSLAIAMVRQAELTDEVINRAGHCW